MDIFNKHITIDTLNWEHYIPIYFQIEWDMIVVTVFLSILNQMEFRLVQDWKENCTYDHIPFNMKGKGDTVCDSVYSQRNLFEILFNQTEISFYLPFSDWFGTANKRPFGSKSFRKWFIQ